MQFVAGSETLATKAGNREYDKEQRTTPTVDGIGRQEPERRIRAALSHLVKAYDYACDVECDPWEFAIEMERLVSVGLSANDLRWLVKKGYIDHAREVSQPDGAGASFSGNRTWASAKRAAFCCPRRHVSLWTFGAVAWEFPQVSF